MMKYAIPEMTEGVFAVGSKDWKRRVFDAIAPTPLGTTYNSYIVKGRQKNALIDTIQPGFESELSGKIDQILGSHDLHYIIMNHAEPDHAGSIPYFLAKSNAQLVTSAKGAELAKIFYRVPEERIKTVKDGDTIDLGGKTLRFIYAPFVHWPETIFTYLPEAKVLFSCDFFGSHNPTGFYDDEAEELISMAKRYYGEIMMPLAKMAKGAFAKAKDLPLDFIAPSHGPVFRHPQVILNEYAKWTGGQTKAKAAVVYVSMYGTTERLARSFAEVLMNAGIEVRIIDLASGGLEELAGQLVDTRALVLATPTVLNTLHPLAVFATQILKTFKPPLKYGAVINSYGWGKGAVRQSSEIFEELKIELVGTVEVNASISESNVEDLTSVAQRLADKLLADGA